MAEYDLRAIYKWTTDELRKELYSIDTEGSSLMRGRKW
jgi:hypothetical protein